MQPNKTASKKKVQRKRKYWSFKDVGAHEGDEGQRQSEAPNGSHNQPFGPILICGNLLAFIKFLTFD